MTVLRMARIIVLCAVLAACSQQLAGDKLVRSYEGVVPLDLSGSWERDYSRGDIVSVEVDRVQPEATGAVMEMAKWLKPSV